MSSEEATFEPVEESSQPTWPSSASSPSASRWIEVLRSALLWGLAPTAAFVAGLSLIQVLGLDGAWAGPEPKGLFAIEEWGEVMFWTSSVVWIGTVAVGSVYTLRRRRRTKRNVLGLAGLLAVGFVGVPYLGALAYLPGVATILDGSERILRGHVSGLPEGPGIALALLFASLAILGGRSMLEETDPEIFVYLSGALLSGLIVSVPELTLVAPGALFMVGTAAAVTTASMLWLRWPSFGPEDRRKQIARYVLGLYVLTSGVGALMVLAAHAFTRI